MSEVIKLKNSYLFNPLLNGYNDIIARRRLCFNYKLATYQVILDNCPDHLRKKEIILWIQSHKILKVTIEYIDLPTSDFLEELDPFTIIFISTI
jgi:hypothetical protein